MMVSLSSISFQSYSCIVMDLSICWGDYILLYWLLITPFMTNQSQADLWQMWQELWQDLLADLAGTVFSLFLFYKATMGYRTLVSPGERRS